MYFLHKTLDSMQVLHISKVSGLLKIPNSKQPIENEQKALRHELNQPTKCPADSASYYQEAGFFFTNQRLFWTQPIIFL